MSLVQVRGSIRNPHESSRVSVSLHGASFLLINSPESPIEMKVK